MPIQAHTRKDPQKGKKEFSTSKGFTVIEMLIVVAVVAILTSLALPSYRTIIEKRQVTSGAEQFAAFFSTVKSQAVKRNTDIAMYPQKVGDEWCLGFKEFDGSSCSCFDDLGDAGACTVDMNNDGTYQQSDLTVLRSSELSKPETLTGIAFLQGNTAVTNKYFVFDSVRGFLEVPNSGYADNMKLTFEAGQYELDLRIDRLGRTYICSPSTDSAVSGYDPC